MNQIAAVPETELIANLLSGIIGRQVKVEAASPMDLNSKAARVYAVYRDTEQPITCLCVCDLPLSVHAAGALLAFPACTINDALRSEVLEEGLLDAVREILNICAQMFNVTGHQVLRTIHTSPSALPEDAREVLRLPFGRLDMAVSVTGAGSGKMSVLIGKIEPRNER